MAYTFGEKSLKELVGVQEPLVRVTKRAIQITSQDFTVYDGGRTEAEQAAYVASGASQTMKSKHRDGKAVDLVPWVNGRPLWAWPLIYPVAWAMRQAAIELKVDITWGCVWDKLIHEFTATGPDDMRKAGLAYNVRHPGKDFPDGPHYQLGRN